MGSVRRETYQEDVWTVGHHLDSMDMSVHDNRDLHRQGGEVYTLHTHQFLHRLLYLLHTEVESEHYVDEEEAHIPHSHP